MKSPLLPLLLIFAALGCRYSVDAQTEKDLAMPAVPEGFDVKIIDRIKCPQNGSKLRLASKKELLKINDQIGGRKLNTWGGEQRLDFVDAALIREDGKIAYRIDGVMPILNDLEALVLDEKVGKLTPKKK